jgi:hypothetical protein
MPLFEVTLRDGTMRLFNTEWVVMVSLAIESGTTLEFYPFNAEDPCRVFQVVENYDVVRVRLMQHCAKRRLRQLAM